MLPERRLLACKRCLLGVKGKFECRPGRRLEFVLRRAVEGRKKGGGGGEVEEEERMDDDGEGTDGAGFARVLGEEETWRAHSLTQTLMRQGHTHSQSRLTASVQASERAGMRAAGAERAGRLGPAPGRAWSPWLLAWLPWLG